MAKSHALNEIELERQTESLETYRFIYKKTGKLSDYLTKLHKKETEILIDWQSDTLVDWQAGGLID